MNVCVVGFGAIGPLHAKVLASVKGVKLYGICDVDRRRADKGAKDFGAKSFYSFDRVLSDKNIDSVHICTPHYLHYSMIVKALDAGKKVVCEKPIVMKEEEFTKLLAHPKCDDVCVVMQNRLNPCIKEFKALAEGSDGVSDFGAVCAVRGMLSWERDADYYNSGEWRGKWETEGGGVMINQAIHTLDYFSYIGGKVNKVTASMSNFSLQNVIEVEDTMSMMLEYENGVKGIFFATNAFCDTSDPMFEVTFEKGVVRYEDGKLFMNGEVISEDTKGDGQKWYWGNSHETLINQFYKTGKHFSPKDVKDTMAVLFACYKSAKTNETIVIGK
jgi:predicted dehydrogenase